MNKQELLNLRLHNQHLLNAELKTSFDVVDHLGAVQAQDYFGSLWTIGLRIKNSTEASIEKDLQNKKVIKTWPMRGTLHYVTTLNVRWMLKYLTPRISQRYKGMLTKEGVTEDVLKKSRNIIEKNLEGNKSLTRDEIYSELENSKIKTAASRGLHILAELSMKGLICYGNRKEKQPTFVLLDEWIKKTPDIEKDEAFKKLAFLFFRSHGPARLQDFCWWSGLTMAEGKLAIELNSDKFEKVEVAGNSYWFIESKYPKNQISPAKGWPAIGGKSSKSLEAHFLPAYDEYTIAYKDRNTLIDAKQTKTLFSGNGFWSSLILNGRIVGMWRRTLEKNKVNIEVSYIREFSKHEEKIIQEAAERYGIFLGLEPEITIK